MEVRQIPPTSPSAVIRPQCQMKVIPQLKSKTSFSSKPGSIGRWLLDVIDDEHGDEALSRFKFETKLFLNRRKDVRWCVGIGLAVQQRRSAVVGRPSQIEVVAASEASLVEDDAAEYPGEFAGEDRNGVVATGNVQARRVDIDGGAVNLRWPELRSAFSSHQCV
jgi:hypothetical protein